MLGTIFAQIFREFQQVIRDFSRIYTKSKLLGVRLHPLHPHLQHQSFLVTLKSRELGSIRRPMVALWLSSFSLHSLEASGDDVAYLSHHLSCSVRCSA